MNELEQKYIDSREVAEMVGKAHNDLLKDIRRYCEQLGQGNIPQSDFFTESTYQNSQNKTMPCYLVTKKGCEFIAHKLTGIKGTEFTAKYINRFHEMEDKIQYQFQNISTEMKAILMHDEKIMKMDERVTDLENNTTIDYGQQQVLGDVVNRVVIEALGGKGSPAYREIGKKVFAECNRDLKHYFNVNARNNVPKKRFDEAVKYVKNWKPCTNTKFLIRECNAQVGMQEEL
ncbi:ORF6C domain-containing protein [Mediterraneibacter glycyrrhizinilyticus]|uniref:Rha family transcriptional regulator n=1 Tax=Mediterraneibacter glycyrrhizinilyticus TaxID=342942 RepID=UPI001D05C71A|nr:Rha family transcriptional regulator [Mediterraneibacter glycyrrhizinilyticus]MCB6310349.1 ORF6C domain-containing protein [Lachnospiraceae bacterium 210521-DFI.1.109]MCB6427849.1 ORF6C domain-containing protein [Mediterraneibacter glycyrrhizinilyticus]